MIVRDRETVKSIVFLGVNQIYSVNFAEDKATSITWLDEGLNRKKKMLMRGVSMP